ncbi:MAG: thioredoxin [Candidatus Obscuribacterales bacterium]|nr:thioredoxin [Candidatus Obscuribacterales bacterium]
MFFYPRRAVLALAFILCTGSFFSLSARAEGGVLEIKSYQAFDKEVLKSNNPVLVDFFAVWCGPCRRQGPIVEKLAKKYKNKVTFAKVDVDKVREVASLYGVSSLPTLVLFDQGKKKSQVVGLHSEEELQRLLETEFDIL